MHTALPLLDILIAYDELDPWFLVRAGAYGAWPDVVCCALLSRFFFIIPEISNHFYR